jgi:hypothetical protein
MITYLGLGIIVLAALYLGWDWLSKNVNQAIKTHNDDNGVVPSPPLPDPVELKPSRIDALRKLEWLRVYYRDNGMEDSYKSANEAAKAMFADEPKERPDE